jgi:hypothetical protein
LHTRVYPKVSELERELQMVQLSATKYSCITILWVSLVSFAAITLCVAFQLVFFHCCCLVRYDAVRKLLDTPSYMYTITNLSHSESSVL